jgi:cell wall-associated NlpC family hydrolase
MKESFNQNGARDRPVLPDEEKLQLSKERRIANRVRAEAGVEETTFRQAEKASSFAARDEVFSQDLSGGNSSVSERNAAQKIRIRRSYAKDVRFELGEDAAVDPAGEGGIRTKAEGRTKSAFYVGEEAGGKTARGIRGRHLSGRRFRRTAQAGAEGIRGTLDSNVLSGEENDPAASGAVRTGYEAARLGAEGAGKAAHFSTDKIGGILRNSAIRQKPSAFYGGEEGILAGEAARQKAEKAMQRRLIRKNYQTAPESVVYIPIVSRIREKARRRSGHAATAGGKTVAKKLAEFFEQHPMLLIVILLSGILITLVGAAVSGGTMLITHSVTPSTLATTYTAEDADIRGAENDYRALEAELSSRVTDLETNYPGYASYELNAGQIGHNPYELAALLTVLHQDYKREDVQEDLQRIFEMQYNLSLQDEAGSVERRTVRVGQSLGNVVTSGYCNCPICCGQWSGGPTASGVYPTANHTIAVDAHNPIVPMGTKIVMNGIEYTVEDTGNFARYGVAFDVYYGDHSTAQQHGHKTWEAFIADDNGTQEVEVLVSSGNQQFTAVLKNNGLDYVAEQMLSKDDKELYDLLVEMKGNKPELFINDIYTGGGTGWFDYTIAGEALSNQKFAGMMAEATKYLGYKYVWGGSNPSTSFDCSGFVCWVINHSGNGWNVGRTTADGLCNMLPKVPLSEAKPGDIIFFQGTYATSGASHVGIIVGDGVMIHCGSPIQYARYDSAYFSQHFYCVGRLPA